MSHQVANEDHGDNQPNTVLSKGVFRTRSPDENAEKKRDKVEGIRPTIQRQALKAAGEGGGKKMGLMR